MTPEYQLAIFFRPANYNDYPVSITDFELVNNENPGFLVYFINRQKISGSLIIATFGQNGRLIKTVVKPFDSNTHGWIPVSEISAAAHQAMLIKGFAVDSNTFAPLCPTHEWDLSS